MSPLRQALAGYLTIRRALGYKLARPEKLLGQLITYLEDAGAATVTTEHALAWATLPGGDRALARATGCPWSAGSPSTCSTIDPAAEVPPAGLIPCAATPGHPLPVLRRRHHRPDRGGRQPAVPAADRDLPDARSACSRSPGCGSARRSASTGPTSTSTAGMLTVRESKFGKSRLVPLHPTTMAALRGYLRLRDRLLPRIPRPGQCSSPPPGPGCCYCTVHATFQRLAAPRRAHAHGQHHAARASMTCDTRSPSAACSTAYAAGQDGQARLTAAVHLPRSHRPSHHLLVPVGRPRTARRWPASGSNATCRSSRDRARAHPAGILHRPAGPPARRQPAHHRRLPRHLAAAARLRLPGTGSDPRHPATSPTWTPPLIGAFLDHLEQRTRQQPAHPQRPPGGDPLTVPLRGAAPPRTRRGHRPGTGHPAQALRPSRPRHLRSPSPRSARCSRPPTGPPGPAGATTPCSCSPPRPACASPN